MGHSPKAAWAVVVCYALLSLFAPHRSLAQADHRLIWHSIESAHFAVHYHEPLGVVARSLLGRAEEINEKIERSLGLTLSQRVALVLTDEDDAANGFANVIPYNAIRLRVAAPDDMSPLADYDDWLRTLLTHEHTHVLHLEETSGIPLLLQKVLGRFYTPQQKLPGWFIEGLAVFEESAQTSGGRARGTMFEMFLRMDALENRLLGLDWIGFDGEPWPHGNVRYLYGQAFVQFIADRYGSEALGGFVREYGRRLVPYGLNRALKRSTGQTFVELYAEFLRDLRERSRQVQESVLSRGALEGKRLTFHGELTRSPRFLSDQEIVYAVADARHVPELRRLPLATPAEPRRIVRIPGTAQPAALPDGRGLLYATIDIHRGRYAFNELFEIGKEGAGRRKLTRALRAREPDVSPDGRHVAYVTHAAGTSHLELAELADIAGTRRVVVRSRRFEQVFTPRFSPDGKTIAYSAFNRGGYRDLWLLTIATGERRRITYDRALDRGPVFSRDAQQLYFSSDRSGIANLYAYRLADGCLVQLTNVLGGAFQPDVSPDGKRLVYVGYGAKGFDLYTLELAQVTPRAAGPSFERPSPHAEPEPLAEVSGPYRPYATLYPRSYEVGTEDVGTGTRLWLSTQGADVVGFHGYALRVAQDLDQNQRAIEVNYAYRRPRFPVFVRGAAQRFEAGSFFANGRARSWDARAYQLGVGSAFPFPRPLRSLDLRAQYDVSYIENTEPFRFPVDPGYPPPFIPRTGYDARLSLSLAHSTAQQQPFDISRSYGHTIQVWGALAEPRFGSQHRAVALGGRAEQFVRFDFRESVLAMAYTGAWNTQVALGGYPARIAPVLDSLVAGKAAPGDYARLRGFPLRHGDQLHVAQLEYRLLLSRINRGIDTLPTFARRVHAALFADAGDAFYGSFELSRIGVGLGAELRFDWAGGGYLNNYMLRAGVARGVTLGGVFQWYTTLSYPF